MAQNRYYSNLSQATFLGNPSGLNNSQTNMQASGTTNWPSQLPFTVILEPNTGNTEIVLVTSGSGTSGSPFIITRGYDGTLAKPHAVSVPIVPGPCQADFAEPQQHLNLSGSASGAHGLPATAWTGGTYQLLSKTVIPTSQTSIVTPTIAGTFNNLKVIVVGQSTYTGGHKDDLLVHYNSTVTNYGDIYTYYVAGGSVTATSHTTATAACAGCLWSNGAAVGAGRSTLDFSSYSDTVWEKGHTFYSVSGDAASAGAYLMQGGGFCSILTGAITSLTFTLASTLSFTPNSTVFVYGY